MVSSFFLSLAKFCRVASEIVFQLVYHADYFHSLSKKKKNYESENKFQKLQRKSGIECGIVKDDSGNNAVFAEQGASTSHMTAAKVRTSFQDYLAVLDKQVMP